MATATPPGQGATPGVVRLHHGTDEASALDLLTNGLNRTSAVRAGGTGEFWATLIVADADTFAQTNPSGGTPARSSFDLPADVLAVLLAANPPRAYQQGPTWYEFLPGSYALLNQHMTNRQVISPVP
jgi:hypothetical protein